MIERYKKVNLSLAQRVSNIVERTKFIFLGIWNVTRKIEMQYNASYPIFLKQLIYNGKKSSRLIEKSRMMKMCVCVYIFLLFRCVFVYVW